MTESSSKARENEQQNAVFCRQLEEVSGKLAEKEKVVVQLDEDLTQSTAEIRKLKDALSSESGRQVCYIIVCEYPGLCYILLQYFVSVFYPYQAGGVNKNSKLRPEYSHDYRNLTPQKKQTISYSEFLC